MNRSLLQRTLTAFSDLFRLHRLTDISIPDRGEMFVPDEEIFDLQDNNDCMSVKQFYVEFKALIVRRLIQNGIPHKESYFLCSTNSVSSKSKIEKI
jgi:hypothetical protein